MSLRDCFVTDESGNTSKAKRQIGAKLSMFSNNTVDSAEYLAVFFLVLIHYLIIESFPYAYQFL